MTVLHHTPFYFRHRRHLGQSSSFQNSPPTSSSNISAAKDLFCREEKALKLYDLSPSRLRELSQELAMHNILELMVTYDNEIKDWESW